MLHTPALPSQPTKYQVSEYWINILTIGEGNPKLQGRLPLEYIYSGFIRSKMSATCLNENLARLRRFRIRQLTFCIILYHIYSTRSVAHILETPVDSHVLTLL